MKKHLSLTILTLTTAALSLTGCRSIFNLITNVGGRENIVTLSKTKMQYTYKDYSTNNIYDVDSAPTSGDVKLLVIPVWFNDSNNYIKTTTQQNTLLSDIKKAYFGSTADTGWNSVSTYYKTESNNKLNLTGEVTGWYRCGYNSTYFYDSSANTNQLVKDAVNWYQASTGKSSLTEFDADKNGYIDGVMLIYASPNYGTLNNENASNMWAYCYWLQEENANKNNPTPNAFFWASYDFLYGRSNTVSNYYSGDTSHCLLDTHTYIHEMGHILGLTDYYDYSNKYCPAGGYSMQDYNVGGHDPYSVMALGWAEPFIPTSTCQLELKPFQESKELILLPATNGSRSVFDEYLLLEYYTNTGLNEFDHKYQYMNKYPQGPSRSGIRLWHVDARLISLYPNDTETGTVTIGVNKIENGRGVYHLMSNTYYDEKTAGYISIMGKDYEDYNLLQLIRNSKKETHHNEYVIGDTDLFGQRSSFSPSDMSKQFQKSGRFNNGSSINWSFTVDKLESGRAVITLTKK